MWTGSNINPTATLPLKMKNFELLKAGFGNIQFWKSCFKIRLYLFYQIRKLISKFSPPQIFIFLSYDPISKKYCRLIENKPPAIAWNENPIFFILMEFEGTLKVDCYTGDGKGCVTSAFLFFSSFALKRYHLRKTHCYEKLVFFNSLAI